MFTVEKCCCFLSLRTGTLCIGIFCLMTSIIHFFISLSEKPMTLELEAWKVWMALHFELCIIDGCLLYGAMKDSKYFLIPWMVFYGSLLVIATFTVITVSIILPISLTLLLFLAPFGYFWLVIMSHYINLDPTRNCNTAAFYREPPAYDNTMKSPEVV